MSNLIKNDRKLKESIVKLLSSKNNNSPFAEFDYEYEEQTDINLNLGSCPSLLHTIHARNEKIEIQLVLLSVVKPNQGSPFLEFLTHRFPDETYSFPICYMNNGELDNTGNNFIKDLQMPITHIGYFENELNTHYRSYYSVYEVDFDSISDDIILNNGSIMFSTLDRMWLTTNEILNKTAINNKVNDRTFNFISNIGEGISRLYKQGEFIPGPRIGYIGGELDTIDDIIASLNEKQEKLENKKTIEVGDFTYGVISSFYSIFKNIDFETISEPRNIGFILRVAFWDKPVNSIEKICTIERSKEKSSENDNDNRISFTTYSLSREQCYPLSVHNGRLTTNNNKQKQNDVLNVLKHKMFIYD